MRVHAQNLSLNLAHSFNLQQLCIETFNTDVPVEFIMSVSAHGGLVHVVMGVNLINPLTAKECLLYII